MPDTSQATATAALAEFDITGTLNPDDAPELFAGMSNKRKQFQWGYWRKPDGEICIAPDWPTEAVQRMDEGWKSLKQYGEFLLQQAGWNVTREPYRLILMNGGAHEFSQLQIVSHNWHKRPPYKGIRFPQLDLELVAEARCSFCRKTFASWGEQPGEAAEIAAANLARHQSVSHKDNAQNAGLARALKEGLLDPQAAAALPTTDLTALLQQMANTQDLILQLLAARESAPVAAAPYKLPPVGAKR